MGRQIRDRLGWHKGEGNRKRKRAQYVIRMWKIRPW